ncbi:MAG: phosphotransferase family protein [Myxococcales bacterium]|nr:phosphotransferase family protein [Myxococcales bacterium]MCB9733754.1 phosphotransferase family protein [Deltaproteobacteria bacterium]
MSASGDADVAAVRAGEELPVAALAAWFAEAAPELAGQPVEVLQFPKGHSNLTYLLRVGERELVLRRPPHGAKIASAHDMAREHTILSALNPRLPQAPRPLAFCGDEGVLGAPFYVMERVRGLIVRKTLPAAWAGDAARARAVSEVTCDALVMLHAVDWRAAGLGELWKGEGYVARQVSGWAGRYSRARTDDVPTIEAAAAWLAAHLPEEQAPALIHNDVKPDNLVLDVDDPRRVVGILDWEMATIGDPLMDLGTTLGYWVQADDPAPAQAFAFCPSNAPGALTRAEMVARYEQRSGRVVGDPVFYYVYGLFKLAVVAQQIYQRYATGKTKDKRFASFIFGVRVLGDMAARAIEAGRL